MDLSTEKSIYRLIHKFFFLVGHHRQKFIIEMQFTWYHDIHSNLLDFSWMNVINVYFFGNASYAWTFLMPSTTYYPKRYVEGSVIWSDLLISYAVDEMPKVLFAIIHLLASMQMQLSRPFFSRRHWMAHVVWYALENMPNHVFTVCTNWTLQSIHSF